jgi:RNA-directed DNA polymerase
MMHGREKSDPAIVAMKPANKAGAGTAAAAELVGPRAGTKRNAEQQNTHRTQGRERVSQALGRVRKAARQRKKEKFTALLHHLGTDLVREAFFPLKRDAAPGADHLTWRAYAADLEDNLADLRARVHRGAYRALPSRRTYIPKADGSQRPLAVAALEDKLVQKAIVAVLNRIYEEEFPRVQLRIPAKARTARCAGCTLQRDHQQARELHSRRRRSLLFRRSQSKLAGPLR